MVIARSPYRISFLGGGSDYSSWFDSHGGAVLSTTIDKYCWITARRLPPFFPHKTRIVYSEIEQVNQACHVKHPAARAILEYLHLEGVEIHHDGDLPSRSGVGSSSAFAVALLHAGHALKGEMVSKEKLSREAIRIERDIIEESGGWQDQIAAAYGGLNLIEFGGEEGFTINRLTLPRETISKLNAHLTMFFVGKARDSKILARQQEEAFSLHEAELTELAAMARLGVKYLDKADIFSFAMLVEDGWNLKKSLSPAVSTEEIDSVYRTAKEAGAFGGKLLGAGSGGFLLLFRKPELRCRVSEALTGLVEVPFKFETEGSKIVHWEEEPEHAEGLEAEI